MKWQDVEGQNMQASIYDQLNEQGAVPPYQFDIHWSFRFAFGIGAVNDVTATWGELPAGTTGIRFTAYYGIAGAGEHIYLHEELSEAAQFMVSSKTVKRVKVELRNMVGEFTEVYDTSMVLEVVVDMEPAGVPFSLQVIDNDEDVFTPIRAKQAYLRINSTNTVNLNTFSAEPSHDDRYYVEVTRNDLYIFKGYLLLDDLSQPFLPHKNELVLKATDRIGTLKEVPLLDFEGKNPRGQYTIAQFIAMALSQTRLALPINVTMNLRPELYAPFTRSASFSIIAGQYIITTSHLFPFKEAGRKIIVSGTASNDGEYTIMTVAIGLFAIIRVAEAVTVESSVMTTFESVSGYHAYEHVYLDAKTFEAEINSSIKAYDVLQRILGEQCYITQERGEWWVKRIAEERITAPVRNNQFSEFGIWLKEFSQPDPPNTTRFISRNHSIMLINNASTVELSRPLRYVRHDFKYELPKEIICNIDYRRGDVVIAPDLGADESTGTYQLECWTMRRLFDQPVTSTAYIERKFIYGREDQRYIVITPKSNTATPYDFVHSSAVVVRKNDKATLSHDFRFESPFDESGASFEYVTTRIWLVQDDGKIWHFGSLTNANNPDTYYWIPPEHYIDPFEQKEIVIGPAPWQMQDVNESEWQSFSVDLLKIPADGKLYIGLNQLRQSATYNDDNQPAHYANIQLSITPFINGTYAQLSGHYNKVQQTEAPEKYNASREKQVYLGDAPGINYKGALLMKVGVEFALAGRFINAQTYPQGDGYVQTWGWWQVIDVWNQFNRVFRRYRLVLKGMAGDEVDERGQSNVPGITHRYMLADASADAMEKQIQLLSYDQDFENNTWTAAGKEVFDPNKARVFTGHEFAYIEA